MQKPIIVNKLQSERGHGGDVFTDLVVATIGISVIIGGVYARKLDERIDQLESTPTPTPSASIDTFENSFNSPEQLVIAN